MRREPWLAHQRHDPPTAPRHPVQCPNRRNRAAPAFSRFAERNISRRPPRRNFKGDIDAQCLVGALGLEANPHGLTWQNWDNQFGTSRQCTRQRAEALRRPGERRGCWFGVPLERDAQRRADDGPAWPNVNNWRIGRIIQVAAPLCLLVFRFLTLLLANRRTSASGTCSICKDAGTSVLAARSRGLRSPSACSVDRTVSARRF
jgi:hypothetical protein